MEFELVFIDGKGFFLKDSEGNYYPYTFPTSVIAAGGRSGGGGGSRNRTVLVQDNGTQVNGSINTLNFTGDGVTVTDGGNGKANISIPGYVIASLTTAQREALVPTTALIVEDTDLDMYFKWSTVSNSWSPF